VSDEGRLVANRYRIIERIGTGAMGAVWKAQDEVLARTVAIKQLLLQPSLQDNAAEDARQRTMREGRIAARLHHPNAITVFDVVTDENDQPCLIMEYLNSTSLAEVLHERRTLPPAEVARIGAQVAAALKQAHAVGIVHRDIKPGNILLAGDGTVKITDFGISRAKDDVTVTKTGMIAGTPAYLAPEVAIGGEPGPESDIFSLGSTLYAACEGQPPFGLSENTLSLLHAVAAGQINPPRQSGPMASVLAVLLHPDVHHRPTAEESEELLAAVARGEVPLGGMADETQMSPVAGILGAGAVGAAAGYGARGFDEEMPAGHSGSLLDNQSGAAGPFYDDGSDDDYAAATGYPEDDYDGYGSPSRGNTGPGTTRAVPVAGGHAASHEDDYDDYDSPPYDDEDEKPGAWKKPAIIGGIVVLAVIAVGVWVFSPRTAESSNNKPFVPPPPSSLSAVSVTSTPLTTTTDNPTTYAPTSETTTATARRGTTERTTQSQQPPPVTTKATPSPDTTQSTPSPTPTPSPSATTPSPTTTSSH
jgi:hypothetical protein